MSNPIDDHVGVQVRRLRRSKDVTQTQLAEAIDVSFQQMQKYEKGTNRISASRLYMIARTLGAPVGYFFEGLEGEVRAPAPGRQLSFRFDSEGEEADA